MRLLDAVVQHAHENRGVLHKVHHKLLALLKRPEGGLVQVVSVVEEQVALAAELHSHRDAALHVLALRRAWRARRYNAFMPAKNMSVPQTQKTEGWHPHAQFGVAA